MQFYYTYILKSLKDSKLYTGATNNLRERFRQHTTGKVFSTKGRGPLELLYYEACQNEDDAFAREKFLKSGLGKRYVKNRLKRSLSQTGFTLIEILVVLSLLGIIGSFTAVVSLDSYRSFAFRSDRDLLVVALQRARSQGMNNVCLGSVCSNGKPHGVAVTSNAYVVFQGGSYASRDTTLDEEIPRGTLEVTLASGSLGEVVFSQLSGTVTTPGSFTLVDSRGHSSQVTVNSEGAIMWTN